MSDRIQIDKEHPWPWLEAFPEWASEFFNGRGEAAEQLLRCVMSAPATVLFGKSGLGKTSLLQAGLFPLLRTRERRQLPILVRLNHDPSQPSLSAQLLSRLKVETQANQVTWEHPVLPDENSIGDTALLWELLHDSSTHWRDDENRRWIPVFVLDQFEEAFTLVTDPVRQQRLFDELGALIQGRIPAEVKARLDTHDELLDRIDPERLGARFVLSLREDYLPDLEIHADRIPRLGPNRYRLLPMSQADALEAIDKTGGALVDTADAERIVRFLDQQIPTVDPNRPRLQRRERIEPALLSLVCAGLNQHRVEQRAPKLDTRSLDRLGGQLLEKFYDDALAALPEKRREAAARFIETELITLDGTRRPFPEQSLARVGLDGGDIARLKDQRLLRTDNTEHGAYVELVHDRIATVVAGRAQKSREREAARKEREKRALWWRIVAGIMAVLCAGLVGTGIQWQQAKAAALNATAQRVLSDANDSFASTNRAATGLQNLLLTMSGHRLAQKSNQPFVQSAGYAGLQREFIRYGATKWLRESGASITCIAISPNGSRIVSGSSDNTLRLWDARSGNPIGEPLKGHSGPVSSVAFSPDGSRIVSGSEDGTLRLWDARSGNSIGEPLKGHSGSVFSVAFSPDSSRIVSGSWDDTLRLWDTRSGNPIGDPLKGHSSSVSSVAFSPDSSRIVSGSGDKALRLWDARSGDPIGEPLRGHLSDVSSVAFSPDGSRIVSGSKDKTLRLWDARSGKPIGDSLAGHSGPISSVAFSPDGSHIVSGSVDDTLRLWDARSGNPISEPLKGHLNVVSSVAFSPDGSRIISGSTDNTLRLWDTRLGNATGEPLKGDSALIMSVAFSPDGSRIVSGSADATLRLWDTRSGNPIGEPLRGHSDAVQSVAFSPDGSRIVSGSDDHTLRLWDARSGNTIGEPLKGHSRGVSSVAFSPDGSRIVSGSQDKTLRLWNARSGKPIGEPLKGHSRGVSSVAFSPDSSHIVSGSVDDTLRLWDASSGNPIGEPLKGHLNVVSSVAFSPDGSRIVSGSWDNTLRLWDAHSGNPIGKPFQGQSDDVSSVAFSPDGSHIVSGSTDNTLRLWDARSGNPIGEPIRSYPAPIFSVTFSPDGLRIVSGSWYPTLGLWPILVLEGWADHLCAKLPRNMTRKEWREWISPDIDYVVQCPGLPVPAD